MKIQANFCKQILLLVTSCFLLVNTGIAQNNGILPLTGLRYFKEGISVKNIDVKIDGAQLLSNRVPLNKEIEIALQQPTGFSENNFKIVFAAVEVIILSPGGEILSTEPNILLKNQSTGFPVKDMATFSLKFNINAGLLKTNFNGTVKLRLYDLKSKNQLRLEMPVVFAKPGEKLQVSKIAKSIKSANGVTGMMNGLKAKSMLVMVDTTIKVAPKMAYTSMDITSIEGSSISGIFEGKENFWVYDDALNEVKITDMLLKQVKGAMENNTVDYTLKIPYRLKNTSAKLYTVRYRWESPDKRQLIDIVAKL